MWLNLRDKQSSFWNSDLFSQSSSDFHMEFFFHLVDILFRLFLDFTGAITLKYHLNHHYCDISSFLLFCIIGAFSWRRKVFMYFIDNNLGPCSLWVYSKVFSVFQFFSTNSFSIAYVIQIILERTMSPCCKENFQHLSIERDLTFTPCILTFPFSSSGVPVIC